LRTTYGDTWIEKSPLQGRNLSLYRQKLRRIFAKCLAIADHAQGQHRESPAGRGRRSGTKRGADCCGGAREPPLAMTSWIPAQSEVVIFAYPRSRGFFRE
jgi:hypothetical protein